MSGNMFVTVPLRTAPVKATEARLERIYKAASLGLKGDSLALAAGMTPTEYRALCQMDPQAELAAQKGRADSEMEHSALLAEASRSGDAKASLAILQHSHGWTARQEVHVGGTISVLAALEDAKSRVINGMATVVSDANLLENNE